MALTNMKNEPPKKETMLAEAVCCGEEPAYPYGLRLCLNDEVLKKLGISTLPAINDRMVLHALVEVVSVSEYKSQEADGDTQESRSVDLQITDMELLQDEARGAAVKLYGG